MGLIDRIMIGAAQETVAAHPERPRYRSKLHPSAFGSAEVEILVGSMDGLGDSIGVQVTLRHPVIEGGSAAVALSAEEAESFAAALATAAHRIPPSDRLRLRRRNLKAMRDVKKMLDR